MSRTVNVYYLQGKVKWCKHQTPDKKFNKWSVDLYMDKPSWKKFEKSGSQLKVRTNEEGEKFITLSRPAVKMIKNEIVQQKPPTLFLPEGDGEESTDEVLIGNGSTIICKISTRDTPNGIGTTWESLKVVDLIEYEPTVYNVDEDIDEPF